MDTFQLTVAHDGSIGIVFLEGTEEGDEGRTLLGGTGVGSMAFLVQASFIADADGMGIVVSGMHADLFLFAGLIDLSVFLDVVVIADALVMETGVMAVTQPIDGETLVAARGTAVNDDQ